MDIREVFIVRMVRRWKGLPTEAVDAPSQALGWMGL